MITHQIEVRKEHADKAREIFEKAGVYGRCILELAIRDYFVNHIRSPYTVHVGLSIANIDTPQGVVIYKLDDTAKQLRHDNDNDFQFTLSFPQFIRISREE
jgi:hypothetical protein